MIRFLMWLIFYLITLGSVDVYVKYSDGLTVRFYGWVTPLQDWWDKRQGNDK